MFGPYLNVPLQQIPAAGGTATTVKLPDPSPELRWFPSFLPDGRHYLYLAIDLTTRKGMGIRVGSLDSTDVRELGAGRRQRDLHRAGVSSGPRDAALVGQRVDVRTFELVGTPVVFADNVGYGTVGYQTLASASRDALVYQEPEAGWHLTWFDRTGRRLGVAVPAAGQYTACVFPGTDRGSCTTWSMPTARRPMWISGPWTWHAPSRRV